MVVKVKKIQNYLLLLGQLSTMRTILKVENISKQYRLGLVGTGSMAHDLNRWWHRVRGKEDPYLKIGEENDRATKGKSDYVWALRDINFEVQPGEVLGIIGKNGAGKSTLLKILSRVTAPTTGVIKTRGRIASLLEVGTGFHGELTGRENIYMNGAILGMTKKEITQKLDEIVDFSSCERYIDTPVKRYSSGMTVRLGFAVAAHLEPDILVVDEVLAVGDAEFQKKAIGKMQDVSRTEGRTVLFVSHNMAAVKSLCTRGIVLENGKNAFEGSAEESVGWYLKGSFNVNSQDLMKREDRKGNRALLFTDVKLFNDKGISTINIFTNEKCEFKFYYDVIKPDDIQKFILSVIIYDVNDNIVASFPSDEFLIDFDTSKNYIKLKIKRFALRPGDYFVSIYSFNNNTDPSNYIDTIEKVFNFSILGIKLKENSRVIRNGNFSFIEAEYS